MSTLLNYTLLLIAATLLIGFFIGWIIRRSSSREKLKNRINELNELDQKSIQNLNKDAIKFENKNIDLIKLKEELKEQNKTVSEYDTKFKEIKSDVENLDKSYQELLDNTKNIENKIESSSSSIKLFSSQGEKLLEIKKEYLAINDRIKKIDIDSKELENSIDKFTKDSSKLHTNIDNLKKSIDDIQKEISTQEGEEGKIKDEFEDKIKEISSDLEEIRLKKLNYQYALKYTKEKIESNEKIDDYVIDKIINKNEEKGLFTNLKEKLFGKSAIYFKGDK